MCTVGNANGGTERATQETETNHGLINHAFRDDHVKDVFCVDEPAPPEIKSLPGASERLSWRLQ